MKYFNEVREESDLFLDAPDFFVVAGTVVDCVFFWVATVLSAVLSVVFSVEI